MNILHSIGAGIAAVGLFLGGLFGYTPQPVYTPDNTENLGRAVNPVATNNYVIAGSGISSSANTITLTSFTVPVSGVPYTMANFGDGVNAKGYLTIEPGSRTRQEIVSFTGVTQNSDGSATLTGVSRGLLPFSPFTASSSYATAHNGGSQVTVSNPPQLYDALYNYVDNATTSGAVDGTTLAKGIYETASGLEAANTTQTGAGNTTATLALTTLISTSTGGTAYTVPVTSSTGKLDGTFCCSGTTTLTDVTVFNSSITGHASTTFRVYTSTSTWSKPTGLEYITVWVCGGGGAGATIQVTGPEGTGGGGSGGCAYEMLDSTELAATSSVVIGVGAASTNGVVAGTSFFGNFLSGTGGTSPSSGANSGGAAGTASGGDLNYNGQVGATGSPSAVAAGSGGFTPLGSGGAASADGAGTAATGYGAGGGGAATSDTTDYSGGAGAPGVVIITEYF